MQIIKRLKSKIGGADAKALISNFSYLSIIEISNFILPFITLPYVYRTIGLEKYGIIMVAYAIMSYFNLVTSFGFRMIATKYVSLNRDNVEKISRYFWTIIFSQLLLLLGCFIVFVVIMLVFNDLLDHTMVFVYAFGMVLANIIFPIWLFQGYEKMKFISFFNVFGRLVYTICVFTFVKEASDFALIPLLNSLSLVGIGFVSLFFIRRYFKITFVRPKWVDMKSSFAEGWHLFLSSITVSLYGNSNMLILAGLASYSAVGIYSIAFTISQAITKIIKIYAVVTFPFMAKFAENKEKLVKQARLLLRIYVIILAMVGLVTYLTAGFIIDFIFGAGNEGSIVILQILAISIAISPLGGFFTPYLVIKNQTKDVSKITFYTAIANFIMVVPLIYYYDAIGMALSLLFTSIYMLFMNVKYNKELVFTES